MSRNVGRYDKWVGVVCEAVILIFSIFPFPFPFHPAYPLFSFLFFFFFSLCSSRYDQKFRSQKNS